MFDQLDRSSQNHPNFCVASWLRAVLASTLVASFFVFASPFACGQDEIADCVFFGGTIATMDDDNPRADWLATKGDRILAVGRGRDYEKLVGENTQKWDLNGRFMMPGFIESHGHFLGLGESRMMLDLSAAASWSEIVGQVKVAAAKSKPGEWIVGRGWHQEKWTSPPEGHVEGYPSHTALSDASPNNPVVLTHASGHMSIVNAYAMRLAGIDANTSNPSGGELLHDAQGNPTGVLRETAQGLIGPARAADERRNADEDQSDRFEEAVRLASEECLQHGVTSFHDAGSSVRTVERLKQMADNGELQLRLYIMLRDSNELLAQRLASIRLVGHANQFLTVRAIKRSIDGALGAHGAWLLLPYEDLPTSVGLNTSSVESIEETAQLAAEHDFQLCVHAIGDKANQVVLDIFAAQFEKTPSEASRRWRIEHAQHLDPADIPRFAKLGVIASMQGIHCTSDAVFVIQRLGMRRAQSGAYVWKSLLDSGAVICNGTDVPVEPVDPIASFYASVTRKLPDGVTFFPEQAMTRQQALRSYTLDAAYAAFEEDIKGSLKAGKLADFVVLTKDLLTCPDDEIRQAEVAATVIGGHFMYRNFQLWR